MVDLSDIGQFVLEFLAFGGGATAMAYVSFQFLSKKWIENKFSERLEAYKHSQNKELQKLRIEIDSLLSGKIRIQEKEFETLPELRFLLNDFYRDLGFFCSPFREFADLERVHSNVSRI